MQIIVMILVRGIISNDNFFLDLNKNLSRETERSKSRLGRPVARTMC